MWKKYVYTSHVKGHTCCCFVGSDGERVASGGADSYLNLVPTRQLSSGSQPDIQSVQYHLGGKTIFRQLIAMTCVSSLSDGTVATGFNHIYFSYLIGFNHIFTLQVFQYPFFILDRFSILYFSYVTGFLHLIKTGSLDHEVMHSNPDTDTGMHVFPASVATFTDSLPLSAFCQTPDLFQG